MAEEIKRCVIVSGAPEKDLSFIKEHIPADAAVIAADSGYVKLQKIGVKPDVIIGDFDSASQPVMDAEVITLPVEKAHTDTFSSVIYAVEHGFCDITLLGAIGDRVDHTYSNILCLDYCRKHGVNCRLMNEKNRISLIDGCGSVNRDYQYFSLFAFMDTCEGVSIEGAYYTAGFYHLDKLTLQPWDQFAQSNYVSIDFATVRCESGTLLLIESND